MADIHGSPGDPGLQMPQAGAGPAPVPYPGGRDQEPEPPVYGAAPLDMSPADGYVVHPVGNLGTAQTPYDVSTGLVTPYYAGAIGPINAAGDPDAGGRDTVAGDVAGAVANATGRWQENQGYAMAQGGTAGDLIHFPTSGEDPGAGVGNTMPTAGFYDPDREYGGTQGAPGYQGEAQ